MDQEENLVNEKNTITTRTNGGNFKRTKTFESVCSVRPNKVLDKHDLESIKFKLRKYYNELLDMKETLKENVTEHQYKIQNYDVEIKDTKYKMGYDLKDLLNEDKESFKGIDNKTISNGLHAFVNETQKKIKTQEHIENLKQKKREIISKFKSELEYSKTIDHLFKLEKDGFDKITSQVFDMETKINSIALSKKTLDLNDDVKKSRSYNANKILSKLHSETLKMNDLIILQKQTLDDLDRDIVEKRKKVEDLKVTTAEKNVDLEKRFKKTKDATLKEIEEKSYKKAQSLVKEDHNIKIILGLYVVQKYFLNLANLQDFNYEEMLESEDFKTFCLPKFAIVTEEGNIVNSLDLNSIDLDKIPKIKFKSLEEKLKNINMNYGDLMAYYEKLNGKTNFFKNTMIKFNDKQVQLECLKDKYSIKVKEILRKNYKNFEDLVKNNSKFHKFIEIYSLENCADKKKATDLEVTLPSHYNEFYENFKKFGAEIKGFYDYVTTNLKICYSHTKEEEILEILNDLNEIHKKAQEYEKIGKRPFINQIFKTLAESEFIKKLKKTKEELNGSIQRNSLSLSNSISAISATIAEKISYELKNASRLMQAFNNIPKLIDFIEKNKTEFFQVNMNLEKKIFHIVSTPSYIDVLAKLQKLLKMLFQRYKKDEEENLTTKAREERKPRTRASIKSIDKIVLDKSDVNDSYELDSTKGKKKAASTKLQAMKLARSRSQLSTAAGSSSTELKLSEDFRDTLSKNIISKLYAPSKEKNRYSMALNSGMDKIKRSIRENSTENFKLLKKKTEINKISEEMLIYNNPKINLDALSKNTYNTFVKYIINSQLEMLNK